MQVLKNNGLEKINKEAIKNWEYNSNFVGWKSKDDFVNSAASENGVIAGQYQKLHRLLLSIEKDHTGINPIKFLAYHYYELELSGDAIKNLYPLYFSEYRGADAATKIFSRTFSWELRDCIQVGKNTRELLSKKTSNNMKVVKENTSTKINKILSIIRRLSRKNNRTVSKNEYKNLKNNEDKCRYVIEQLLGGEQGSASKLINALLYKEYGSKNIISQAINIILKKDGHDFIINKARISNI